MKLSEHLQTSQLHYAGCSEIISYSLLLTMNIIIIVVNIITIEKYSDNDRRVQ